MSAPKQALWNAVDAAAATGGRSRRYWEANGVSIDSRNIQAGDLFVALSTDSRDGHAFVGDALKNGAAAAMVACETEGIDDDAPLLVVDDTMSGLERLGMFARSRCEAKRVAITGSVGKTGTKMALEACLARIAPTHASVASYNNHWGVPLTLARMPQSAHFGVFEIGMNHAGEIAALSPQVGPDIAVITTIAPAHLAFFNSTEGIAHAKAEIFQGVQPGGIAVIHGEAPHAELLIGLAQRRDLEVITFGRGEANLCRLISAERRAEQTHIVANLMGEEIHYSLAPEGDHWVDNSLAVAAVLKSLDVSLDLSLSALADVQTAAGRGASQTLQLSDGPIHLIDESYNANPVSVAAALRVLGHKPGRKVAILGDMLELGTSAPAMHADLASVIEDQKIDLVLTCGPLMAMLNAAIPLSRRGAHAKNAADLATQLGDYLKTGDTVLIKGSLGSRMKTIVDALIGLNHGTHGSVV